jgi:putative toxin-antitoxin system antitoxin component (TIGR02293 family)
MNAELANRYAAALAAATGVFGGRKQAKKWMSTPVMGLDGQRPIDLLRSAWGAELVKDFLTRLEYGVYT